MKKIFMSAVAAFIAISASAQVYVGGNAGIASTKIAGGDRETTYKLLPEVGYQFSEKWAGGIEFGWSKGNPVSIEYANSASKTFEVNPYARYTLINSKMVDVFIDGTVGYKHYNGIGDEYQFGLKPGVALNLSDRFSFVAKAGFLGYKNYSPKGGGKSSDAFGVSLDSDNLSFGLLVKF